MLRHGPADGLPSILNMLAIDRQGLLWLATSDGLARYDGSGFRFWRREVGVEGGLPESYVVAVQVDPRDRVWAATWTSLNVLDRDRRAPRMIAFDGDRAACVSDVTALHAAHDGTVWIASYGGELCRLPDGDPKHIQRLHPPDGRGPLLGALVPIALRALSDGALAIGTDRGLFLLRDGRVRPHGVALIGNDTIYEMTPDRDGATWVATHGGQFRMTADGALSPVPWRLPAGTGNAMALRARDGRIWIGASSGLYVVDAQSGRGPATGDRPVARPVRDAEGRPLMPGGVFHLIDDREGGLWFAGKSEGLFHLPPGLDRFTLVTTRDGAVARLRVLGTTSDPSGGFWVLAVEGLFRLDDAEGRLHPVAPAGDVDATSLPDAVAARARLSGIERPRRIQSCGGWLWLAADDGLYRFDSAAGRMRRHDVYRSIGYEQLVEATVCDGRGGLWVSMMGGEVRFYPAEGPARILSVNETLGAGEQAIARFAIAPDGVPWLYGGAALKRWDGHRFVASDLDIDELQTIAFTPDGDLWVARFGALERYRRVGSDAGVLRRVERVDGDDGWPAIEAADMMAGGAGQLWLGTPRGLLQYDIGARRVRWYGVRDGLPGADTSILPLQRAADGRGALVWAQDGLALFDPARPTSPARRPTLTIAGIDVQRGDDRVALAPDAPIRLLPGDRDLRVSARADTFSDPARHRYRFLLHGDDPDWVEVRGRGERVWSRLRPGDYRLELKVADGEAWSTPRMLRIEVLAPWWRRPWAWVLYALLVSGIAWWWVRQDRARMRRRHNYQLAVQKRADAEEASLAKSRFLADLGHEVRTPMTGVLGMSELLLSTSLDDAQRGRVRAIRGAGEHLLRLLDDALDLAKIEAGRLELLPAPFAIRGLVDEAGDFARPLAARKGLACTIAVSADVPTRCVGDATRIRQILFNLLGNAVKFTEVGGVSLSVDLDDAVERTVERTVERGAVDPAAMIGGVDASMRKAAPLSLRIRVRDTGPGMDAAQCARLFQRFAQADGARTERRYGGTGLGLAISRELAEAMGGGIEVESTPGLGTMFTVRLQLEMLASGSESGSQAVAIDPVAVTMPIDIGVDDAPREAAAIDVLLVEDDPVVAEVVRGLLLLQGHAVVHAAHGLAAMTEAAMRKFDLAMIDLDLPGMDGFAVLAQLRRLGHAGPAIAITARADRDAETQAAAAGFDGFLRKPLAGAILAETIAGRMRDVDSCVS